MPTLASVTNAADAPATVTVVHGIPSVGNVDVCAGGTTALLSDVPFGGVATISVPAGTYDLTVKVADPTPCTGATAITLDGAVVPAGANVSVVANLTGGTPNLAVYANDVSAVAAGQRSGGRLPRGQRAHGRRPGERRARHQRAGPGPGRHGRPARPRPTTSPSPPPATRAPSCSTSRA